MSQDSNITIPAKRLTRRIFLKAALGAGGCVALGFGVRWLTGNAARARLIDQTYEPPPDGMVFVPAEDLVEPVIGFLQESGLLDAHLSAEPDERPLRRVFVPAFSIDRFEVTNRQFQKFKPDHPFDESDADLPVTYVFREEAMAYCRFVGKRLPTNAEWEKAARGTDGRTYPWGNQFRAGYCNLQEQHASNQRKLRGGSFPQGASPYGCQDMCGNVWEWVRDVQTDTGWFGGKTDRNPRGIIRGAAYSYSSFQGRSSYQGLEALNTTCHDIGFRCAMDAIPKRT